jgi:hypothetical protein
MEVAETNTPPPVVAQKLYMENTLLRVAGALFCHDAKRAALRTEAINLNRGVSERAIAIEPHPKLGQPGPLAHKIFIAILKKHSNYGRPHPHDVSFTKREIMRLVGRAKWGGRDSKQLGVALDEIHRAFISASFKSGDRFFEERFHVFSRVLLERAAEASDAPIERCTVTLATPIIESLRSDHFTCYNYLFMQSLGTIGQALYMRLFFHFANLYETQKGKAGLAFQKRYDDVCVEWLGGLAVHDRISQIKRDQLGPHLDQLVEAKFLSSYAIDKAKSRAGFVITFRPGAAFFSDYEKFYRNRNQGELQWSFDADRREIAEPLKLAYLFAARLIGKPLTAVPYVSQKETESAKFILEQVAFENAGDFLDYALAEAKRSRFEVKSLGGVRGYLPGYIATLEQRRASKAVHAKRQEQMRQEREQASYREHRHQAASALLQTLPKSEQEAIEAIARQRCARPFAGKRAGALSERLIEMERARVTAERHPDRLPTFADWKSLSGGAGAHHQETPQE